MNFNNDDDEQHKHRLPTLFQRPDRVKDPLYVITPIFNPIRWRSRWKLYQDFAKRCEEAGAILYTIELAFGDRAHSITDPCNPRHIQVRGRNELWLKENMLNVAVSRLPSDWKYVAWVDADVLFTRADWANETIHQLQHYDFVQMWSQYQDLTSNYELIGTAYSFIYIYLMMCCCCPCQPHCPPDPYPYPCPADKHPKKNYPGAPGLAWACTRRAWDKVGGLIDCSILGACDWYMAHGLVGKMASVVNKHWHPNYRNRLLEWGERAAALHRNVGVVDGLALHFFHGPKALRKYKTRDQILVENNFDPDRHLRRDWQGVYQLEEKAIGLRDSIRQYFRERNEDAV